MSFLTFPYIKNRAFSSARPFLILTNPFFSYPGNFSALSRHSLRPSLTLLLFPGPKEERDDLVNPYWMEDKSLKRGEVDYMPGVEVQFWKDLIEKYLHPLTKNSAEQVRYSLSCFLLGVLLVLLLVL